MSRTDLTWQYCACHPSAVEVVQHFCGPDIIAGEAVCSRLPPGAPSGGLHKDCAQDFVNGHPDTQCCWGVNGIWMLTDFTEENGATHVGAQRSLPFALSLAVSLWLCLCLSVSVSVSVSLSLSLSLARARARARICVGTVASRDAVCRL